MAKKTERKKLLDKLEGLWSAIVRYRDKYVCRWCGKGHTPGDSSYHASHIRPKSRGHACRFDLLNGKGLCMHCHLHVWHKDPLLANKFLKTIRTPEEIEYLDGLAVEIRKYTNDDLTDMIRQYEVELEKQKYEYEVWLHGESS